MADLVVGVELLQLVQNLLRGSPERATWAEADDCGEQEAALLSDQLLGGGRCQLRLKLQDLLLL